MKNYTIRYRDADPGCPVFSTTVKAYSRDHAIERFLDSDDGDDGWIVVSVELARTRLSA